MGRPPSEINSKIRKYMEMNPHAPYHECAAAVGIPEREATARIANMRQRGILPNADGSFAKPGQGKKKASGAASTPEGRRNILEQVLEGGLSTAQLQAFDRLEALDLREGNRQFVKPPLTHPDKVRRLALLIEAAGPSVTKEALAIAEKAWKNYQPINWVIGGPPEEMREQAQAASKESEGPPPS